MEIIDRRGIEGNAAAATVQDEIECVWKIVQLCPQDYDTTGHLAEWDAG